MATTEKLQNEILLKEEAFLKEAKATLTEQLNKLKVGFWEKVTLEPKLILFSFSSIAGVLSAYTFIAQW